MPLISIQQCPSCGASASLAQEQCSYCNNHLIHLTPLERRKTPAPEEARGDFRYFHSLRWWYIFLIVAGMGGATYIYVFNFDNFSETEMVNYSPFWFMSFVWGLSGLYSERVVRLILGGNANKFTEGLHLATKGMVPILVLLIYLLFLPPFFLLGLHRWKLTSPLLIGLSVSLLWGLFLFVFLYGVFPSL